ncbi:delta carbonic anhydrase [Amphidinium carterae]
MAEAATAADVEKGKAAPSQAQDTEMAEAATAADVEKGKAAPSQAQGARDMTCVKLLGLVTLVVLAGLLVDTIYLTIKVEEEKSTEVQIRTVNPLSTRGPPAGVNPCSGKKPTAGFENFDCFANNVVQALEQSGANVTKGYNGERETSAVPITDAYWRQGLCPVNVHWHLGAEHLSVGEYDESGSGPSMSRRLAGSDTRLGFQCTHFDGTQKKFTKAYDWKHCIGMEVGQTYEVHWPHSRAGKCGTINQYQTPFYDGVFCEDSVVGAMLDPDDSRTTFNSIGVQAQVFVIVNDERYYYPDLFRGMIVDGDFGSDMAMYTGSTTGTSRDNEICSAYAPITWQVDRKCHLVSASSFDKMCAEMKAAQRDDMSDDLYAHGARELVADELAANNHQP